MAGAVVATAGLLAASGVQVAAGEPSGGGTARLTIVALNDFHGALYETPLPGDPDRAYGGLPFLAGAVAALRAETPDLLLLDGGDLFQGSWPVNQTKGQGSVLAYNLLGVDAAAVGNHELDYGAGSEGSSPLRGAFEDAARRADFAWLSANVLEVGGGRERPWSPTGVTPYALFDRGGVKVGVIGLTTTDTPQTTRRENVADLRFEDPVAVVGRLAPELRDAGAKVVVVLGHLTGECVRPKEAGSAAACEPDGEIGRLLRELPEGTIDVLVAAHEHTFISDRIGDTFVVESGSDGRALGRVDLVVGPDGVVASESRVHRPWMLEHERVDPGCDGGPYPLAAQDVGGRKVTPSKAAVDLVRALEQRVGSLCEKVACATTPLSRSRTSESAVGDLMADAMRAAMPAAQVALQNSGGLRADLPAGTLRRSHVQAVMPFDNQLVLVRISGERLRTLIRIGSSGAHGLLQVSGISFRYDPHRTGGSDIDGDGKVAAWEQDRLCSVRVGGEPIDPARTYEVAVADFLLGGGDDLGPGFEGAEVVEKGPLLRDAFRRYLEGLKECIGAGGPVVSESHPRIEVGPCL